MASVSSVMRTMVLLTFGLRCYAQVTMALKWVPGGRLEDFNPQLYFGSSVFVIITHACLALGGKKALGLIAITAVLSYCAEQAGVATGGLFGEYDYPPDRLGPKIGHVPLIVPFSWITVVYCAQAITNAATNHGVVATQTGLSFARVLFLAVIDGAVCTMYDLGVDPVMVHNGYWTWRGAPESLVFFGVPIQNFVGWFVTGVVISACVRLMLAAASGPAAGNSGTTRGQCGSTFFTAIPIMYYFGEALYSAVGAVSPFDKQMPLAQRQSLGLVVTLTAVTWSVFALGQIATAPAARTTHRKAHSH